MARELQGVIKEDIRDSTPDWDAFLDAKAPPDTPNVLVILYDDTGQAAWSPYGGRITMPTLDRLAQNGLTYTQWHTTAVCSPTRSCFLTGRNHHQNGFGSIAESATGFPGYSGHRPPDIATMATVLRDAGYSTLWIGKNHDWLPTFMAMAGDPDIPQMLLTGYEADGRTFKVDIDGYNLLPYLTGEADESPRKGFIYFNDDGDCVGVRYGNFKIVFMEQRCPGTLQVWAEPFTPLRVPKVFNLRTDPFERADITSNSYWQWMFYHGPNTQAGVAIVQAFTETFKDFPPRQKAASFTLEQANDAMMSAGQG